MKNLIFKSKGTKSNNPFKFKVIADLNEGKKPLLKIIKEDGKLQIYYEERKAGVIDDSKNIDMSKYSEYNYIFDIFEQKGEVIAKAIEIEGTNFIGEIEINDEIQKSLPKCISITSMMEDIAKKEIDTKENLKEKINYLKNNNIPNEIIRGIFESYEKLPSHILAKVPKKPKMIFKDYFGGLKKALVYIHLNKHLKFEGDKGCGKNKMITTIAWLLNRPLYEISMNSQIDKMDLQGSKTLTCNKEGNTEVEFDKSPLVEGMEYGGIVNLDEVNTVPPEVLALINSTTDSRRSMFVPGYKKVQANKNFRVIITLNKDYQGTFELNEASNDRFVPIIFPIQKDISELLQHMYPYIKFEIIKVCQQVYQSIQKCIKDERLESSAISIRGFQDVCEACRYLDLKDALIDNIANRVQDNESRVCINGIINDLLG